ncbi:UDP-glycosyltransferase 87A1 [Linum grandiflorum]
MESKAVCHLVAMPFPGRGHINPMMNLCKLLASRRTDLLITFVITEEWLGYIGSEPKPDIVQFRTIPNGIIPPERLKAADFLGFYEAVMTKMESPFEQLLDQLQPPVTAIIGDIEVRWAIGIGNRRNIPVAAFWTMSASFFSMLYHLDVSASAQNSSPEDLLDCGDSLPGISTSQVSELKKLFQKNDIRVLQLAMESVSKVTKAQYLLFTSIHELEVQTMDSLSRTFPFPVYPIGPAIPYLEQLHHHQNPSSSSIHQWLDNQPTRSVLYISLGSFLSVSSTQMDEILDGLRSNGVRFLWVARGEAARLSKKMMSGGEQNRMVVAWCDQLKVLSHCSVGGFWSHCGWNSTLESVYSGVPMLTFPLFLDQDSNSKLIVEKWRVGWELDKGDDRNIRGEEIAEIVRKFMNLERKDGVGMRKRAREVGDICNGVTKDGGSSVTNLDAFIAGVSQAV